MKHINKSIVTNILAVVLIVAGIFIPFEVFSRYILTAGLFAFSGALTNWLAVYMLFDKVPGVYGSGVIQIHFDTFKDGMKSMIMEQFFKKEQLDEMTDLFFQNEFFTEFQIERMAGAVSVDHFFDRFVKIIMDSKFGSMLNMFGGPTALESFREKFNLEIRRIIREDIFTGDMVKTIKPNFDADAVMKNISIMIDRRLETMTPRMVKNIVQDMIRKYMDWLVVWGGVFGAVIGVLSVFLRLFMNS